MHILCYAWQKKRRHPLLIGEILTSLTKLRWVPSTSRYPPSLKSPKIRVETKGSMKYSSLHSRKFVALLQSFFLFSCCAVIRKIALQVFLLSFHFPRSNYLDAFLRSKHERYSQHLSRLNAQLFYILVSQTHSLSNTYLCPLCIQFLFEI